MKTPLDVSGLRLKSRWLPVLVGLLLLMQIISPYRGWIILLAGLGGVWALSAFWARSLARHLHFTREMRFGWAQVGDHLVERFTLSNDGVAPALWVEVVDRSTLPGYNASRGTGVSGDSSIRWHKESVCGRRGLFYLGPTWLNTGDPFGIYEVTWEHSATMPLLVLPPIVPLPAIEVAPGGRTGEGHPRSNALERTVSVSSVRPYAPGDSRRWIHWKVSAHRDELFVRLFDGTPSGDWWILLDMDRYVQAGTGEDSTAELGVILAASLADRGLRAGKAVGLMAHGKELVWLPPRAGEGQRWEILRALALVSQGTSPLSDLLARVKPVLGHRDSLVIITPSTDALWVEALLPLIRRGAVPTVLQVALTPEVGAAEPAVEAGVRERAEGSLAQLGVAHYTITGDLLERPEAHPGKQGQWQWKVLGTGRVVPVHHPVQAAWKEL